MADRGDSDDLLSRERVYNLMAEMLAAINKGNTTADNTSKDTARWAQAASALADLFEARIGYLVSEFRVHVSDVDKRIEKRETEAAADRKTFIEHVIAIRTGVALASNDAGDAKNAATATAGAVAGAVATIREDTAKHHLPPPPGTVLDEHGKPAPPSPRSRTPATLAGVGKEVARGVFGGLPTWARVFLATLLVVGMLAIGLIGEWKWGALSKRGGDIHEPREPRALPEHKE